MNESLVNRIHTADACRFLRRLDSDSIACSLWSPPYHVGKSYEEGVAYADWQKMLATVITEHRRILKPGGFLAVNIADILCFSDVDMPRIMAENVSRRKIGLTREEILEFWNKNPDLNRYQVARHFGCSEQTIDRRMNGNNIRGGKQSPQTRVKLVGGFLEETALEAELYLYDRRVWVKDAAWENSKWHTISYRSVDEFEYVYIFWKPGVTRVDRDRIPHDDWVNWGSRAVWSIPSVRANDNHEAKFPIELPQRIIRLLSEPGETVLDCFVGSGTTAVAAILERRNYIGVDIEARYARIARRACQRAQRALGDDCFDPQEIVRRAWAS